MDISGAYILEHPGQEELIDLMMLEVVVVCEDQTWKIQEDMLHRRSRYFAAAFQGRFRVSIDIAKVWLKSCKRWLIRQLQEASLGRIELK